MTKGFDKFKKKYEKFPIHRVSQTTVLTSDIYSFDLNDEIDPKYIASLCLKYQIDKYKEKNSTESVYAWRSDYLNVEGTELTEFLELFSVVEKKVKPLWSAFVWSYCIHHFWYAIYNKGDYSKSHNHGLAELACVYYAECPENSSPLMIPNDNGDIKIQPKEGQLIVMPGRCFHYVPKSDHEGRRTIVAMNVYRKSLLP